MKKRWFYSVVPVVALLALASTAHAADDKGEAAKAEVKVEADQKVESEQKTMTVEEIQEALKDPEVLAKLEAMDRSGSRRGTPWWSINYNWDAASPELIQAITDLIQQIQAAVAAAYVPPTGSPATPG